MFCAFYYLSSVVHKLVRAVTQIKIAIMFYYPQYNTEQHCGFASVLPPEESHITPVWEPLS